MGLGHIIFLIVAPIGGMTIAAFSLKKQLPKACRLFGNYIGLSYVYFKSTIKIMKPQDHMTYEMMDIARKTSQQSQALKRQLRNTVKKVKQEIKQKRDQTFKDFEQQFPILRDQLEPSSQIGEQSRKTQKSESNRRQTANSYILSMESKKKYLLNKKILKKQSRKFYEQI